MMEVRFAIFAVVRLRIVTSAAPATVPLRTGGRCRVAHALDSPSRFVLMRAFLVPTTRAALTFAWKPGITLGNPPGDPFIDFRFEPCDTTQANRHGLREILSRIDSGSAQT